MTPATVRNDVATRTVRVRKVPTYAEQYSFQKVPALRRAATRSGQPRQDPPRGAFRYAGSTYDEGRDANRSTHDSEQNQ